MSQKRQKAVSRLEKELEALALEIWHKDVEICILSLALGYHLDGSVLQTEEFLQFLNTSMQRPEVEKALEGTNKEFFLNAINDAAKHLSKSVQAVHEQIKNESN